MESLLASPNPFTLTSSFPCLPVILCMVVENNGINNQVTVLNMSFDASKTKIQSIGHGYILNKHCMMDVVNITLL